MSKRIVPPEVIEDVFLSDARLLYSMAQPVKSGGLREGLEKVRNLLNYSTGSVGLFSNPKARPTKQTYNTLDWQFTLKDLNRYKTIFAGLELIRGNLNRMDLIGGEGNYRFLLRCVFPDSVADMMYGYSGIMRPAAPGEAEETLTTFYQIGVPYYEIEVAQAIENKVNLLAGGNYVGMIKKAGFTLWLHYVNEVLKGFGMHGGCKKITVTMPNGNKKKYVVVIIGDSGHGKSTLSFSDYGMGKDIETLLLGDDMVAIVPNGSGGFRVIGFENLGLYLKSYGVSPNNEPLTYEGAMGKNAILENVPPGSDMSPRFDKESENVLGTNNHRAIVPIRHFCKGQAPALDIPLDDDTHLVIMLLTRAPELPAIVKYLTPELATSCYGALPSETTSAREPGAKGGDIKYLCGADDFTPGPQSKKLQRMLETLRVLGDKVTVLSVNTSPSKYKLAVTEKSIKSFLAEEEKWISIKELPGRMFLEDPLMEFDEKFVRFFGELIANQKRALRDFGAPKEVIDAL
jgi:hypothetical protein